MKNVIKQAASLALAFMVLGGCTHIKKSTLDDVFISAHTTFADAESRAGTDPSVFSAVTRKTTASQSETLIEFTAENSVSSTKKILTTEKNITVRMTTVHKDTTSAKSETSEKNVTSTKEATTATQKTTTATKKTTNTTQNPSLTKASTARATVPVQKGESVIIGLSRINFGCDKQAITAVLGTPSEIVTENLKSGGTVTSLVYAENYEKYVVFQLTNGSFFAIYTVDETVIVTDGDSSYSLREGGETAFSNVEVLLYKDTKRGGKVYAMKAICGDFSYYPHELSSLDGQERLIFHTSNAVRAINGLYALEYSEEVSECIKKHCEDMSARDYFSHDTPEGVSSSQRLRNSGIEYICCGENLAAGYKDAFSLVDGWYNSAGHRKNLLDNRYRYLGVAVVEGNESYRLYAGQNFYA